MVLFLAAQIYREQQRTIEYLHTWKTKFHERSWARDAFY